MLKKCTMPVLSGLLLISTIFTFTCTLPLDPDKNPDVVEAKIFPLDKDKNIIEGKEASFGISLTYPKHVDSVVVSFDGQRENDTTVKCKTKAALPETLVVKFIYAKANASQKINADVFLANGKVRKIQDEFMVRKKDLSVLFVSGPKPHLAPVNESDTLQFIASKNPANGIIAFSSSSEPSLDDKYLQLITRGDTALLIATPIEEKMYNIYCYATYVYALDTEKVAITSYRKPLFTTSSHSEEQLSGTEDTLLFTLPSSDSGFQISLLDSSSYSPKVLSRLTNAPDKISFKFTPVKIDTYLFSLLVEKGNLTDTVTYQRKVIGKQNPVWKEDSAKIVAVEGNEINFSFASYLTDSLKNIPFSPTKGKIVNKTLKYQVPWGCDSTDIITIEANDNGVTLPFKLYLNISHNDSIAPKILRVKPVTDTINTDKLTCEFKISDLGAGVGDVKFEHGSKVITDTVHKDSIYKCNIGGLKHGETVNIKVTATDKSMRKNSNFMLCTIVVIKSDTAKSLTAFGFRKPLAEGAIDNSTKKILVTVPFGTDVRSLAAVFTITGASLMVDSKEQKSDTTINDFTNPVKYTVVAVDKSTTEYEVTVAVASPGKNADLSGLTVSSGSLTPAFSANTTNYTVNLSNSVDSLTVTGTLVDTNATINYVPSQKVKLSAGDTMITVNVTAQDNTVKKKYEIKVIRAASSNANLSSLTVNQGILIPAFSPEITSYTVNVAGSVDSITVTGTLADTNATINYVPTQKVKLPAGNTTITVNVTSQDSTIKKKYEIKVIRIVSSSREITSFGFDKPKVTGIIDSAKKTISVTVPNKTDVTALTAIFTTTGKSVKVGTNLQESGKTPNNFKDSVIYTVIAANDSTQNYVVKVFITPPYEYTVAFKGQGATIGPNPETKKVKEPDTTVGVLPTEPKKDNYKFDGWYTDTSGLGTLFTGTTKVTKNTTVYAKWAPVYKVTYDANGANGTVPKDGNVYKEDESVTVKPVGDLTKTGNTFKGWTENKDGSGKIYNENDKLQMGKKDIILYAKWEINTYTVNFVEANGAILSDPKTVNHGYKVTKPADPDKPGYKFIGWYNGTAIWNFDNGVTSNLTLTAKWAVVYKLTYNGNHNKGGSVPVDEKKYVSGDKAIVLGNVNNLSNTACVFEGWKKLQYGIDNIIKPGQEITITKDDTLYAVWTISDRDGNIYATVQIGNQLWMAENLKTTLYQNSGSISLIEGDDAWTGASFEAYCYPNGSATNMNKYGLLYNYNAIKNDDIAPAGWHVSYGSDWDTLEVYLISHGYNYDNTNSGNKIAKSMAAKELWETNTNEGAVGNNLLKNNRSGFTALPAGGRAFMGAFTSGFAYWWCREQDVRFFSSGDNSLYKRPKPPEANSGYSVRLIRN